MESTSEKDGKNKSLIYDGLINFSETITTYFAGELQDFLGLITFIDQVSLELKEVSSKINLPKNYNPENPDNLNINSFYSFQSTILNNIKNIPDKINNEVLSVLKGFKDEFESDNKNIFFSLNSIIEDISNK